MLKTKNINEIRVQGSVILQESPETVVFSQTSYFSEDRRDGKRLKYREEVADYLHNKLRK